MLGAPCRNCAPKEAPKAHCGHDCCPKPKPAQESKPCSWQPAGFDAIEKAKETIHPGWHAVELPSPRLDAAQPAEPRLALSAPEDRPPPLPPPAALPPLRL
jgi:hypothetical protein